MPPDPPCASRHLRQYFRHPRVDLPQLTGLRGGQHLNIGCPHTAGHEAPPHRPDHQHLPRDSLTHSPPSPPGSSASSPTSSKSSHPTSSPSPGFPAFRSQASSGLSRRSSTSRRPLRAPRRALPVREADHPKMHGVHGPQRLKSPHETRQSTRLDAGLTRPGQKALDKTATGQATKTSRLFTGKVVEKTRPEGRNARFIDEWKRR